MRTHPHSPLKANGPPANAVKGVLSLAPAPLPGSEFHTVKQKGRPGWWVVGFGGEGGGLRPWNGIRDPEKDEMQN